MEWKYDDIDTNHACMSNMNIKCGSLIVSNAVFKNK